MLFKRISPAKRVWKALYEELEPLNQKLKDEIGFSRNIRNVLWDELVFNSSLSIFAEALNCFHYHLFEASTLMCRNSIDSTIFLAWHYVRTDDLSTFKMRESRSVKDSEWRWKTLKTQAIELKLLNEDDLKIVEEVREKGHFSAHTAVKQEKARSQWDEETYPLFEKWQKENAAQAQRGLPQTQPLPITRGYKRWTTEQEAFFVLIRTKDILVKIISNYFNSEKTRIN